MRLPRPGRLSFALLLAGCASPDIVVSPAYEPRGVRPARETAGLALRVQDSRSRKAPRSNGREVLARGKKGSVFLDGTAEALLREATEKGLRKAGFTVRDDAPVVVEVDLRRLDLDANQFTEWKLDRDTGSTLDLLRVALPGKVRETRALAELTVTLRKHDKPLGISYFIEREASETTSDRIAVQQVVDRSIGEAIDELVEKVSRDAALVSRLPVSDEELRARLEAIERKETEIASIGRDLERRSLALEEDREALGSLRAQLDDEGRRRAGESSVALAGREKDIRGRERFLAERLEQVGATEEEHRILRETLLAEQRRLVEERRALARWREDLDAERSRAPPPAIVEAKSPLVVLTSPQAGDRVTTRTEIRVQGVVVGDRPIADIEWAVNGVTFAGARAFELVGMADAPGEAPVYQRRDFSFPVRLREGRNRIEIRASDADGLTSVETLDVEHRTEEGQVHLVGIGIGEYEHPAIPALRFAAKDVEAFVAAVRSGLDVPEENVTVLVDERATLRELKFALGQRLWSRARRGDTVIIYFAGHGATQEGGSAQAEADTYLLPHNADPADFYATAFPLGEIARIFDRIDSEKVIFLADSCYSGAAGGNDRSPRGGGPVPAAEGIERKLEGTGRKLEGIERKLEGTGRIILAASRSSEVAQERESLGRGVFTHFVIRGLEGAADSDRDGRVTAGELFAYVSGSVAAETHGGQNPQMSADLAAGEIVLSILNR